MPANVAGQNLARTGKAARRAFVQYKDALTDARLKNYAEAYWRHRRREQVARPDHQFYFISERQAAGVQGAVEAIIMMRGIVVEKRASR